MGSRARLNLVLLALVAGLVALAVFEPGKAPQPEPVKLSDLAASAVTRIRIVEDEQGAVALVKAGERWRLSAPFQFPANGHRVASLAEIVATESYARLPAAEGDLSQFGLDKPRFTLALNDLELAFGLTEPLDRRRYVQIGDTVHLIDDRFHYYLTVDAPSWVDLALLGPERKPTSIEVRPAAGAKETAVSGEDAIMLSALRVENSEQGWQVSGETPATAPADAVTALVDAWRNTQAVAVRGLDTTLVPVGRVTIALEGEAAPVGFGVASQGHEVVLQRKQPGIQYHLPRRTAQKLLRIEVPKEMPKPGN